MDLASRAMSSLVAISYCGFCSAAGAHVRCVAISGSGLLTQGNVVFRFDGDVLPDLSVVYLLEDSQAMAHAGNAHLFEFVMFEGDQCLSNNAVLDEGIAIRP